MALATTKRTIVPHATAPLTIVLEVLFCGPVDNIDCSLVKWFRKRMFTCSLLVSLFWHFYIQDVSSGANINSQLALCNNLNNLRKKALPSPLT